jgi:hypothetical protein
MRYATIILVAAALTASGCGGSDQAESTKAEAPESRALTQGEVLAVHLRTPRKEAIARLGPPSATGPKRISGDSCLYWRIVGQPSNVRWRFCFRNGRVHVVATYIG